MTGREPRRLRAWLELLRISNLPTVASNVLVGTVLGAQGTSGIVPWRCAVVLGAGALFYLAGMALNDAFDAPHDRAARSARPIPSGRIGRPAAFRFGFGALAVALLTLLPLGSATFGTGVALAAVIVLYDHGHHRQSALLASLLMGLCRALLVLLAAHAAAGAGEQALPAVTLGVVGGAIGGYTAVVTWLARGEEDSTRTGGPVARRVAHALPILGLLPVVVASEPVVALAAITGLGLLVWHVRSLRYLARRPPLAIMGWLAGLSLVDACVLSLLGAPMPWAASIGCFGATALLHRRILGS